MKLFRYLLVSDAATDAYSETVCYDYAASAQDLTDGLTDGEGGWDGWTTYPTDITEVDAIPQQWIDQRSEHPYFVMPTPERPVLPA